jgi:hypothetical protein
LRLEGFTNLNACPNLGPPVGLLAVVALPRRLRMSPPTESGLPLPPEIDSHYAAGLEADRLVQGSGRLELARAQEILRRLLPPPPAAVIDVGVGPGRYACWLGGLGYEVHLYDPVPLHVVQAEEASRAQPAHPIASCTIGEARALGRSDDSTDAVLVLGP